MLKWLRHKANEFFAAYCREFMLVLHDGGILLFFLFLPLAYPVIYSLIYNPEVVRDVPMVVVDHDRTPASRELVRSLDATQETWIRGYAADLPEARHAMNSHKCFGILEIPSGFGRAIGRGEQAEAVMYCDMSLMLRYRGFLVASTNVAQEMGSEITYSRIGGSPAAIAATIATGDPLPVENVSLGNIENGFDSFIMPGVVILILHQCIILASGMAGGAKREKPSRIGYVPYVELPSVAMTMAGQMLCYITILLVPAIFLVHYIPLMFAFPMAGDFWEILAFLLPMVLACLGVGLCFQGIVREREAVFVLWVATSVVFLFLTGITWPRYAMTGFWRFLSDIVPGTWGVEGFIKMNTNGSSLAQVRGPYINLWILAAVYISLGYVVQRWVVRPAIRRSMASYQRETANDDTDGNLSAPERPAADR